MEYLQEIIFSGFLIGLLIITRNFLSELPQRLHDIKMEGIKNENAKQIQIDSFYRQTSNEKLMKTLSSWIQVIYDIDEFSKKEPEDFTGYKIDSEQLLRAKISDYYSKEAILEKCKAEAIKQSTAIN